MELRFVLIILGLLTVIIFITLFLYRKLYEKKINQVLESDTPKKVLSPVKVFFISLFVLFIIVASLWRVVFPDYNKMDLDSTYNKSTISLIEREIMEMYKADDNDLYFTQGDYIDLDFDEEFNMLDNQFNNVSFEKDGLHNRLQYVIYGSNNEVWIPTSSRTFDWSLDETPYRVLRYLTVIQLLNSVDIQNVFLELGELQEDEWYNLNIEGNFINDYSLISYYVDEGFEMYFIDELGNQTPMNETSFQDDRVYIALNFNVFSPSDSSNSSFSVSESITYYFDVTDYIAINK